MQVKYLDLHRQFQDPEIHRAIARIFTHCQFVLGPEVAGFEAQFAQVCGTRWAVGVNSATDALFLALKALGVARGMKSLPSLTPSSLPWARLSPLGPGRGSSMWARTTI